MLYDAIEKLAAARGAAHLSVDASDTAREFFVHRGFAPQQRNTVLGRRRMAEQHDDEEDAGRQRGQVMTRPDTPFPRHWRYYIVLKYLLLAAAVALALKYFGVW